MWKIGISILVFLIALVTYSFGGSLDGVKICLDPGHGGTDPGSSGPTGLLEKDENLLVSQKLKLYLENEGATIIRTRIDDTFISLERRVEIAKENNPYWFISLHLNAGASGDHTTNYTEAYYYRSDCDNMSSSMAEYQHIYLNITSTGSKFGNFYVIRESSTTCRGNLSEAVFISCTAEESLLKASDDREEKIAKSICQGVVDYFTAPFVKNVYIKQNNNNATRYLAYWDDGTTSRILNKVIDLPVLSDATVTIDFSEPVQAVVVKMHENPAVVLSGTLDSTCKVWTGTLTQSQIQSLGSSSKGTLSIFAKDFANNLLDVDPSTIAFYNKDTNQFENYESSFQNQDDIVHSFTIASPPQVAGTFPSDGAISVSVKDTDMVVVSFNQSMSTSTLTGAFSISPAVPGDVDLSNPSRIIYEFQNHPEQYLHYSTKYTVKISASATSAAGLPLDGNGNGISEGSPTDDYKFEFSTEAPDFALDILPLIANVPLGTTVTHNIKLSNNCVRGVNFNLVTKLTTTPAPPGWTYTALPNKTVTIDALSYDLSTFDVTNNGAVSDLNIDVKAKALDSVAGGESFLWGSSLHIQDHPDETYDISDGFLSSPWLVDTESEVGIFLSGYGDGIGHFFGGQGIRTAPVKPDLSILGEPDRSLNDLKVLFIGSGALSGFDNSPTFRQKLADYVSNGGTIICFGQQYGYEYSALPGELTGFGWAQDQNCFGDAVTIRSVSAVFNGQRSERLNVNVDGYFTKWPQDAKILLDRNENNLPAMLEYTYGQGRVIVSSLYSDWGYRYTPFGEEEQILMKQLLSYALDPTQAPTQSLGSNPNNQEMQFAVSLEKEIYAIGEEAVILFHVWNRSNETRDVECKLYMESWHAERFRTQTVGVIHAIAGQETTLAVKVPVSESWGGWAFVSGSFYDYNISAFLGWMVTTIFTYVPSATVKVTTDQTLYETDDDKVTLTINAEDSKGYGFSGKAKIRITNDANQTCFFQEQPLALPQGQQAQFNAEYMLPAEREPGIYTVNVELLSNEQIVGSASTFYEVPNFRLTITPHLPEIWTGNNPISFDLKNIGSGESAAGTFTITMLAPDGQTSWTRQKQCAPLSGGAETLIEENVVINSISLGNYKLNYEYRLITGEVLKGAADIPNSAIIESSFNQLSYKIGEDLSFNLKLINNGIFEQKNYTATVEIPDLAFQQEQTYSLAPLQKVEFSFTPLIPEIVKSGQHEVKVTLKDGESILRTQSVFFAIPESNLSATVAQAAIPVTTVNIANTGGVDTTSQYSFQLIDNTYAIVHTQDTLETLVRSGETVAVSYTLPTEIANSLSAGEYYLKMSYKDVANNIPQEYFVQLNIAGVAPTLLVATDKTIYSPTEQIFSQAKITSPQSISNATLDIKITAANPAWTSYTNIDSIQKIIGDEPYLWFQTSGGVRRFDTQSDTWRRWTTADGLGGNRISNMFVGTEAVWSSSYDVPYDAINMRLSKIDKTTGTAMSFQGNGNTGIVIGENEDYVLTWYGGYSYPHLFSKHDHLWQPLEALWSVNWESQAVISGNTIWILSQTIPQNLYRYDIASQQLSTVLEGLSLTGLIGDGNILWLANANGGFYRYDTTNSQLETISNSIAGYLLNNENELWLVGNSNIVWYDKTTKQFSASYTMEAVPNFVYSQNHTPDYARCFAFDNDSVWVATANGLKQLHRSSGTWQTHTTADGLLTNYTTSVAVQSDYVWIGTPIGVSRYNKAVEWKTYTDSQSLKNVYGAVNDGNTLWLTNSDGLLRYDQATDSFSTFVHSELGHLITADSAYIWVLKADSFGQQATLMRFTKDTQQWQETDLQPALQAGNFSIKTAKLCNDEEAIWLTGTHDNKSALLRYDKSSGEWNVYDLGPQSYGHSIPITVDNQFVWIGTDPVSCFDKQSRQIVATLPALSTRPVVAMSDTGNELWLVTGEIGGPGYGSSPSALITLYKIDKENKQVLKTVNYSGCLAYRFILDFWLSPEMGGFIADGSGVWIAAYLTQELAPAGINKVLCYDEISDTWKVYGTEDGLVGGYINDIVAGRNGLWFTSDIGLGFFRQKGAVLWQKQLSITGTDFDFQEAIGQIGKNGKYYIDGVLTSSIGQELAKSTNNFYVATKGVVITADTDKKIYAPGETITITGAIINIGEVAESGISYTLLQDESMLYSGTASLGVGETQTFTCTTTAVQPFGLKGTVTYSGNSNEISQVVSVMSPQMELTVTGPDEVGQNEFDLGILVKNTGQLEANVRCQISDASQTKDLGQIILQAGETKYFSQSYTITQDTDFKIELTGDVTKTIRKTVKFGCAAEVNITPALVYPASTMDYTQIFSIPIEILNTGTKDLVLSLTFKLSPAQGTGWTEERGRSYYILPGEKAEEGLVFEGVPKGDYTLTYTSDLVSGSAFLRVAEFDVVVISEVEVDSSELALKGTLKGTAKVKNAGANEFVGNIAGSLMLKTESENRKAWEEEKELTLGLQEEKTIEFEIPVTNLSGGEYSIVSTVLHNGSPIAEKSAALSLHPQFEIISFDDNQIFNAGGQAAIKVKVKNNGPVAGQAEITLAAGDIINSTQALWLTSNEEKEVTFNFTLADDLEEKTYNGTIDVRYQTSDASEEQQIQFYVNGYKIGVTSSFDQQVYKEGETAHLTLILTNEGSLEANVYAKVNFNDYEVNTSTITVSTGTSVNLTFDVPVRHTGQKLFYGIYHASGRSLNLNTLYIYEEKEGISLTADKQQYMAAEQVNIYVIPESTGTLHLSAPGYSGDTEIISISTSTLNFTLPQEILTGTHYVEYTFQTSAGNYTGKLPIDVVGYTVKTLEVTLDKDTYEPGQTMLFKLKLDVNKNIANCLLKAWLKSDNSYELVVSSQTQLTQGINLIEITAPMTLQDTGMAALVFGLYKGNGENELLLAAGQESFDVENVQTDTQAPITTLAVGGLQFAIDGKTYITESSQIYFVAVDSGAAPSGIEKTEYSIDSGSWNVYRSSFTVTGDGEHTIQYRSKDKAGNVEEIKQAVLVVDTGVPLSQLTVNSQQITVGEDKYLVSPASFTITAADTGSGTKEIEYQLNDQSWQVVASTETVLSFALADGNHNFKYYAIDNLNHNEEVKTFAFKTDATKPATQMTVNGSQVIVEDKTYITGTTEINLTAADPVMNGVSSGIAEINYRINASSWTVYNSTFTIAGAGETTVEYYAIDKVGNREDLKRKTFWTDNEPPETKLQLVGSSWEIAEKIYISKETKIELTATDEGSGVEKITYQIDNSTPTIYTEPFVITQEGIHSILYFSQDKLGNSEPTKQKTMYLDLTPPESSWQITEPKYQVIIDSVTYVNSHSTFTLTAVDPVFNNVSSGLKQTQYQVDDNNYNIFSSTYTRINLSTIPDGQHIISYFSNDNVENAETIKTYTAIFDGTKPEVKETYPQNKAMVSTKKLQAVKITFSEPVQCEDWYQAIEIKEIKKNGKEKEILTHKGKGKGFTISYDAATYTLSIEGKFKNNREYEITLKDTIADRVYNYLDEYAFSFKTMLSAKEGGTVYDQETGLLIIVLPNTLPCDGYFETRIIEQVNPPKLPKPLCWLFDGRKAYQIIFRNEEGEIVKEQTKQAYKVVIILKNNWLALSSGHSETQESIDLEHTQVYQTGTPEDIAIFQKNQAILYNGETSRLQKPLLLSSQNVDTKEEEITAEVNSFGIFGLATYRAPEKSLDDLSCYPSPFDPYSQRCTIQYYLEHESEVAIAIYDLLGNLVRTWEISNGEQDARSGLNQLSWDGKNDAGDIVANGGYIVFVHADGQKRKFKVMVVK